MAFIKDPRKQGKLLEGICSRRRLVNLQTLESVILLAIEIAREGREDRKIGTMFIVSDSDKVLKRSSSLILDPLLGHPDAKKCINDPNMRETIKELAQLDGAFIVSDDGVVISGARYINASSTGIRLPLGLGSRHMAAASITKHTNAVAVVVSESSLVRVFDDGGIVGEIISDIQMINHFSSHIKAPFLKRSNKEITVLSKDI
jgi:diadenylate cyclase